MPESLDALLVEVGEDYGQEADQDLYYFEEYGCESDDGDLIMYEEAEGSEYEEEAAVGPKNADHQEEQIFLTQAF